MGHRLQRVAWFGLLLTLVAWSSLRATDHRLGGVTKSTVTRQASLIPQQQLGVAPSEAKLMEPRERYRGFYVDLAAALFGWLAVAFALITVVFTIVGIRELRDVKRKIAQELQATIQTLLDEKIQEVTDSTIRPKIQSVLDEELRKKLDHAVTQFDAEVAKSLQNQDVKKQLVDAVAEEIKIRLSKPQTLGVSSKEFEPQ